MRRALALSGLVSIAACSPVGAPALGERGQAIIGGTNDTGDPAVVLVIADAGQMGTSFCTGEVVSPHVVLTAAHCVNPAILGTSTAKFYIFIGNDYNNPTQQNNYALLMSVKETHFDTAFDPNQLDGGHDVGVLITRGAMKQAPLPMNRKPITNSMVGQPLRLVGYGVNNGNDTQGTSAGTKRQTTTPLSAYDSQFLQFGNAQRDTCEGDSGGPAFMNIGGTEYIVGITSFGPQYCMQGGFDTRVDVYATGFADPYIAANDPNGMQPPPDMAQPNNPNPGNPDLAQPNNPNPGNPDLAHAPGQPGGADMGSGGSTLAPVGAACQARADCQSGLCATMGNAGFCTTHCDPAQADTCPAGTRCGVIEGDSTYCIKYTLLSGNGSSGCDMGAGAGSSGLGLLLAVALITLGLPFRRRRAAI